MSGSHATAHAHADHAGHHELGFFRTYVFSTDHKTIGRQFLFLGLFMMILGGILALMVRWQLAWPETAIPGMQLFLRDTGGILDPPPYNMAFTMHATIMIFFVIMPILAGGFGNYLIPLMIGARDMAFPRLNAMSYWLYLLGGIVLWSSWFATGGTAKSGWWSYPTLSELQFSPGHGQDY
ncbi:MAG: cbb3-type cytochrome c oxidase subunit I, partial [Candidatus Rokubacteria bacterium]|nr:cbb3-type cytochrome c oxidase subunit I [Candidatus Rokubacteria bacterium]